MSPGAADRWLTRSAALWLGAALLGQWAFFWYIASFYGVSTFAGDFEVWNRLQAVGRTPFVPGDTRGNLAFAAHALGAGLVAFGGALQLMPQVRARWPRFHRWNGRVFLVTVVALSLSGFYLVWGRGSSPSRADELTTSFNGVLILLFAGLAWQAALARDFTTHRVWAMRLFLVSNAQWFLRVGVFGYFVVMGVLGLKPSFRDPFLVFWKVGCFLVPLAVLECYLRAQRSSRPWAKLTVTGLILTVTLLMLAGMSAYAVFSHKLATGAPIKF